MLMETEFTYQEPRFPYWLPERYRAVTTENRAWRLKTEALMVMVFFEISDFPHKIAVKEIWIGTGHDDICFNENLILIDNQGQEAYRIGTRIEEIFAVYNMGCPLSRTWLLDEVDAAIERRLEYEKETA